MFGFSIWLIVGGTIGWLYSIAMRAGDQHTILTNILAGVVGSYVAGVFLAPWLRSGPVTAMLSAAVGAGVMIALVASIRWRARR